MLDLSAPKVITFIASVVLALVAVVIHYAHIAVPFSRTGFTILLVAYAVLAAGNVFRDLRSASGISAYDPKETVTKRAALRHLLLFSGMGACPLRQDNNEADHKDREGG